MWLGRQKGDSCRAISMSKAQRPGERRVRGGPSKVAGAEPVGGERKMWTRIRVGSDGVNLRQRELGEKCWSGIRQPVTRLLRREQRSSPSLSPGRCREAAAPEVRVSASVFRNFPAGHRPVCREPGYGWRREDRVDPQQTCLAFPPQASAGAAAEGH